MQPFQLVRILLFQILPNTQYNSEKNLLQEKIFTCLPGRSPELW